MNDKHLKDNIPYQLGTGLPRALNAWPKIDLVDQREVNQFKAIVWRTVIAKEITSVEKAQTLSKTSNLILELLSSEPQLTLAQVASHLGKSKRGIEMAVAKLKESGKLKYVGSKKMDIGM